MAANKPRGRVMFEPCYFEPYDDQPLIERYVANGFDNYGATYVVYPIGHGYNDGDYYKPGICLPKVWCKPGLREGGYIGHGRQGVPDGPYTPNDLHTRWVYALS